MASGGDLTERPSGAGSRVMPEIREEIVLSQEQIGTLGEGDSRVTIGGNVWRPHERKSVELVQAVLASASLDSVPVLLGPEAEGAFHVPPSSADLFHLILGKLC